MTRVLQGWTAADDVLDHELTSEGPGLIIDTRSTRLVDFIAHGLAEIGVVVGAWLDPEVRGAALIGVVWIAAALGLYAVRFRSGANASGSA